MFQEGQWQRKVSFLRLSPGTNISAWGHCYRAFYGRNLQMFLLTFVLKSFSNVCRQDLSLPKWSIKCSTLNRHGWKSLLGTNMLAYSEPFYNTPAKSFIALVPGPFSSVRLWWWGRCVAAGPQKSALFLKTFPLGRMRRNRWLLPRWSVSSNSL